MMLRPPFSRGSRLLFAPALVALSVSIDAGPVLAAPDGKLSITVVDEETRQPVAVRMELRDARGRVVRLRPEGAVAAGDSFYFDGETTLGLRRGSYTFLVEAGPEYVTRPGKLPNVERHAEDSAEITISRRVEMRKEGWWAGDLDVQIPLQDLPLMMRARSVDYVPVAALVNDNGRCRKLKEAAEAVAAATSPATSPLLYGPWASLDHRRGGGLLAISENALADVCQWNASDPSLPSATASREAGAAVIALTPHAWDLPLWVAAGKLDAVQIIHRHAPSKAAADRDADGRPRDATFFPGKLGDGRYSESIYHHLLNCGLRIPPAAGSGAGVGSATRNVSSDEGWPGILGANRVYVHCGETCTPEAWLAGLRAGRVVVTNGPLLRPLVEGEPPGHVFSLEAGERRAFQIALNLAFYEQTEVEYLEIIQNGKPVHQVRLDELAQRAGRLPPVEFDGSGWFSVRAVTNNPNVYQFASSGPYYVEANYQPRVSRTSVQFFLDWLDGAAKKFADNKPVLAEIEAARPFWQKLLDRATVD